MPLVSLPFFDHIARGTNPSHTGESNLFLSITTPRGRGGGCMCAGTHSNTESSGMVVALRLPGPPAWSQREQKHNLNPLHQNWLSVAAINWSRQLDGGRVGGKLRGSRSLKTYKPCTSPPAGSDESIKTIWSWLYSIHGQVRIPSAGHLSARGFQKSPYL